MRVSLGRRAAGATLALLVLTAGATVVEDPGQGPVALADGPRGTLELSGITWAGGARYLAVSDEGAGLCTLEVPLDPASGRVRSAAIAGCVRLEAGADLEGVARADDGMIYVSDEQGPAIRRYDAETGAVLGEVAVPARFARARRNLSLEALALAPDGAALWTANEEALEDDGPTNYDARGAGTRVRLQRFAPAGPGRWRADGQWAYPVDGVAPFLGRAPSGVVDLAVLPGGRLLVLERAVGALQVTGEPPVTEVGFRSRIYVVELAGASDTTRMARLGASVRPVAKTLLWESTFRAHNFEGMALGPALEDGRRSLLLVADGGQGLASTVYALRVLARSPATR